ncbi:hypothetical protein MPSEU_000568800 [Mayamaea pseudoterrestris]|nr:hypothetical protein MPSEU_000568800 [Mayamaea pseudoterrestris]
MQLLPRSTISLIFFFCTCKSILWSCEAFAVAPIAATLRPYGATTSRFSTTTLLATRRKRRRKTSSDDGSNDESDEASFTSGDLPDFDIAGDDESATTTKKAKPIKPNELSPEMMARSSARPARSVNQLIQDRALESKFVFDDDEVTDRSLPDLAKVVASSSSSSRKRKRTSKKTTIPIATEEKESPFRFLESIPFFRDETTGKVTPLKVLEGGTWLGIVLLLTWEVYINTPLFDRAAPLVPIVY